MPHLELIQTFTSRFESLRVPYMVTGSVAAMFYGEPRFTNDIDLVLSLPLTQLNSIAKLFPAEEFYFPSLDVVMIEARRAFRGHFNIIHHATGFKADVYLAGKDALHAWGMGDVRKIEVDGQPIPLAPIEYVILRKLEYYREGHSAKHVMDIRNMLELSSSLIRFDLLDVFIVERHLREEWKIVVEQIQLY